MKKLITKLLRPLCPITEADVAAWLLREARKIAKTDADDAPSIHVAATPAWAKVNYDSVQWSAFAGAIPNLGQSYQSLANALARLEAKKLR